VSQYSNGRWRGDLSFLLSNLILKDFRIRYRNMSLGVFWSLANPLIMMGVLTFVFTAIFPTGSKEGPFPVFVLCGLIPYNFFTIAWQSGTTSLVDYGDLVKRLRFPREIIPAATVLSNVLHLLIQLVLLFVFALAFGGSITIHWLWIPLIVFLEVVFICGLALISSAVNVYLRDTRYVVESACLILFWMVPIFYSFTKIPARFHPLYQFNPLAAVVFAFRAVLLNGQAPAMSLMSNLFIVSTLTLVVGVLVFRGLKKRMYDYL
jgi:lipopolysaccharide transport system permease protein